MSNRLTLAEYAECCEFFNSKPGLLSKFLAYHNSRPVEESPRQYDQGYAAGFKEGQRVARERDGKDT